MNARIGDRVRLKGKKRISYVRQIRRTARGWEIALARPLAGFTWHDADTLELVPTLGAVKPLVAAAALLAVTAAPAADRFPFVSATFPVAWEAAFAVAEIADMSTTASIKHMPGRYETNSMLGREPSDTTCLGYGLAAIALHVGVTYALTQANAPSWLVTTWEATTVSYEVAVTARNYSLGYRFKF